MSTKTGIEWTDATWNPIRGCSRVSEGCRNCYAEAVANRFCGPGNPYEGLVQMVLDPRSPVPGASKGNGKWSGQIKFVEEHLLDPLKWKKPRRIFVNSMSDLFHEGVTDEMLDRIFAVMALCPQHTFQVLTKRPERMLAYLSHGDVRDRIAGSLSPFDLESVLKIERYADRASFRHESGQLRSVFSAWPFPNVQLGVSVEDQKAADARIPLLLQTPAAVRFISAEPLLGPIDLTSVMDHRRPKALKRNVVESKEANPAHAYLAQTIGSDYPYERLDWVIVGGETGFRARPMHPDWARGLRDQCVAAGVPFFFKQWGAWGWQEPVRWSATPEDAGQCYGPFRPTCSDDRRMMCRAYPASIPGKLGKDDRSWVMLQNGYRVGKKAAGRLLDGREWNEMPIEQADLVTV